MFSTWISKFALEMIFRNVIVKTETQMPDVTGNTFFKNQ